MAANATLSYVDERIEQKERQISAKETNLILVCNEMLESIRETDYSFYHAYYEKDQRAWDTIQTLYKWHMGEIVRPPEVIIYPSQRKSHRNILLENTTSPNQTGRVHNAVDAYEAYVTWILNKIEQDKDLPWRQLGLVRRPVEKITAQDSIKSLIEFCVMDVHKQKQVLILESNRLALVLLWVTAGTVIFFLGFIGFGLHKMLKPFSKSQEKLESVDRQMFRAANVVFWEYDLQKNEYFGGKHFAQFFGKEGDEFRVSSSDFKAMLLPGQWDLIYKAIQDTVTQQRKKESYEFGLIDSNGKKKYIKALAEYQYDEDGELIRRHGIMQDVTMLKHAEKELEISRERLSDTLHKLGVGVVEVEPIFDQGKISDVRFVKSNLAFCDMCQIDYGNLIRSTFSQLFEDAHPAFFRYVLTQFNREKGTLNVNVHYKAINKWLNIRMHREVFSKLLLFVEDITEDYNLKERLRQNQERLALSEQMARLGYCEINLKTQLFSGNRIAFEIHGLESETGMSVKKLTELMRPEEHDEFYAGLKRLPSEHSLDLVYRIQLDEKIRYIHCVLEYTGQVKGAERAFGFMHDITDLKHKEIELRRAMSKAQESERLKSAFLANMSHEIRTPLSAIVGFAGILARNKDISAKEREECNALIDKNSNALMYLINDIVELSKIESGEVSILPVEMELNRFLDETYEVFSNDIIRKGKSHLRLFLNKTIETDFTIEADTYRLNQIVNNLVSNAIKFTSKGFVEIGYEVADETNLVIYVRDSGIGIEQNKLEVIFDMFRQEDIQVSGKYGGTGLGLAICKKLVELMEGKIWVESKKGVGSTFFVSIPVLSTSSSKAPAEKTEILVKPDQINFKGKTILIADDEEFIHILFRNYLQPTGANILNAYDGEQVLDVLNTHSDVDLILLDMRMPKLNGMETLKVIRDKKLQLPVIAQTAYAFVGDRERFIAAGCNDYISKPAEEGELLLMLKKYLG